MLTPAQAAFLAGLPQRPTTFNPYRQQTLALSRQRVVLRRMVASGALSAADAEQARQERLNLTASRPAVSRAALRRDGARRAAGSRGRRASRRRSTPACRRTSPASSRPSGRRCSATARPTSRSSCSTTCAASGWRGKGRATTSIASTAASINGPRALRQPGSALKPFTYALAFEQGFTPASVLPDVPMHFPTAEPGVIYRRGTTTGASVVRCSRRRRAGGIRERPGGVARVRPRRAVLLRFFHRAGFSTFDKTASHYGLGLTLGNAEVRLDEMVAAYAAFARGGTWRAPSYLASRPGPIEERTLVSPRTAFWLTDILSDNEARSYIFGRGSSLEFPFPVAVKTGTSQAYHDNWTIGYTRRVTVGVWVGNFDRRPLRNSSGVTGAAPIFQAVMLAAHRRAGEIEQPLTSPDSLLTSRDICGLSGEPANQWCPVRRREWLPAAGDAVGCTWHHASDEGVIVVWPPHFREWARQHAPSSAVARTAPPITRPAVARVAITASPRSRRPLELVNPPSGATYLLDPTLRREFQTLPLRVVAANPTTIEWSVNGSALGTSSSERAFSWPLQPGRHRIAARDASGATVESVITVR